MSQYTVSCQRCGIRPAVGRKIDNERPTWLFSAATDRPSDKVRLCASCIRTLTNVVAHVAQAMKRRVRVR